MTARRILLGSGCNESYYPQMLPYLHSVEEHNTIAEPFLVGVGWKPPAAHGFTPLELPMEKAVGRNSIFCVQHGAFLHALDPDQGSLLDDDVIVFTDGGDVIMQRDFSESEKEMLLGLDTKTVLVGWNNGPHDTLEIDGERMLRERFQHRLLRRGRWKKQYPDVLHLPNYNTGVVIATVRAYRRLFEGYLRVFRKMPFHHPAKMQWGMCLVLGTHPGLRVQVLSQAIHTHQHHPLPPGAYGEDGKLYFEDQLVVFRHNYPNKHGLFS